MLHRRLRQCILAATVSSLLLLPAGARASTVFDVALNVGNLYTNSTISIFSALAEDADIIGNLYAPLFSGTYGLYNAIGAASLNAETAVITKTGNAWGSVVPGAYGAVSDANDALGDAGAKGVRLFGTIMTLPGQTIVDGEQHAIEKTGDAYGDVIANNYVGKVGAFYKAATAGSLASAADLLNTVGTNILGSEEHAVAKTGDAYGSVIAGVGEAFAKTTNSKVIAKKSPANTASVLGAVPQIALDTALNFGEFYKDSISSSFLSTADLLNAVGTNVLDSEDHVVEKTGEGLADVHDAVFGTTDAVGEKIGHAAANAIIAVKNQNILRPQTVTSFKGGINTVASISSVWDSFIDDISTPLVPLFTDANPNVVTFGKDASGSSAASAPVITSSTPAVSGVANTVTHEALQTIIQKISTPGVTPAELASGLDELRQEMLALNASSQDFTTNAIGHALDSLGRQSNVNTSYTSNNVVTTTAGTSDAGSLTGTLGIAHGGTGQTTAPTYGQLLLGNSSGGFDLVATSSLGIVTGGASQWDDIAGGINYAGGNVGIGSTTPTGVLSVNAPAGSPSLIVGSSTATSFIVDKNGKVGIGTATPDAELSIVSTPGTSVGDLVADFVSNDTWQSGFMVANSSVANNWQFMIGGSANAGVGVGNFGFYNSDTHNFPFVMDHTDDNVYLGAVTGLVGIGTTAPVSQLANTSVNTLDGAGTGSDLTNGLTWASNNPGYVISAANNSTASNANGLLVETAGTASTNRLLTLNANGADQFVVEGSGNVGIGTSEPNSPLTVQYPYDKTDTTDRNVLTLKSSDLFADNPWTLRVGAEGGSSMDNSYYSLQTSESGVANGGDLLLQPGGGNVGIGTTNPGAKLDISAPGNNDFIQLHPTSAGYSAVDLFNSSGISSALFGYNETASRAFFQVDGSNNFDILTQTGAVNAMHIDASGNVGIGTTNPEAALDVRGGLNIGGASDRPAGSAGQELVISGSTPGIAFQTNGSHTYGIMSSGDGFDFDNIALSSTFAHFGANTSYIASGNVGIGTTTPGALFAVQGNGLFSGNLNVANLTATGTVSIGTLNLTNALGASSGGTGINSVTANAVLIGNPGGTALTFTNTPGAGSGAILRGSNLLGNPPSFGSIDLSNSNSILSSSKLPLAQGGTNNSVFASSTLAISDGTKLYGIATSSLGIPNYWTLSGGNIYNNSGTNVGISSTTPGSLLSIGTTGGINFNAGANATSTFGGNVSVNGNINLNGAFLQNGSPFVGSQWTTSGSNLYYNPGDAAIGIGISSPNVYSGYSTIQVNGSTQGGVFQMTTANGVNGAQMIYDSNGMIFSNVTGSAASKIKFSSGNSPGSGTGDLTIDTTHYVGVGTTTPWATLSVNGTAAANNFYATNAAATTTLAGGFVANNGTVVSDFTTGLTTLQNAALGTQFFDSDSGIINWIDMPVTSASILGTVESYSAQLGGNPLLTVYGQATGSGGIQQGSVGIASTSPWAEFAVNPTAGSLNQFVIGSSTKTSFLINNAGQVGIGTTSPYSTFSVNSVAGQNAFSVGSSTGTYFTVGSTGQVGIGTTTPGSIFAINGVANFTSGTTTFVGANGGLNISSGCYAVNGTCLSAGGASSQWTTSGTNISYATGAVGIGTSTPFSALSVSTSTPSSPFTSLFAVASSTNATLFNVLGNGNVGIGTTTPWASLGVNGIVGANSFYATNASATSTFIGGLDVGNGSISYDYTTQKTAIANLSLGNLSFDTDAGVVSWADMPVTSNSSAGTIESYTANINGNPELTVYSQANGSGGIQDDGVGIATTSPFARFAVNPVAGDLNMFDVGSSSKTDFIINNAGFVGIGTSSPTSLFYVAGSGQLAQIGDGGISAQAYVNFNNSRGFIGYDNNGFGGSGSMDIIGGSAKGIEINAGQTTFGNSNTPGIAVTSAELVGIGTSTPVARLDVVGSNGGTAPLFQVSSVSGYATTTQFYVTSGGNVGVGTTSPFATFSINPVAGNASNQFVIGSSTATNFIVTNGGLVGIGTTTPWASLSVNGTTTATSFYAAGASATSTFVAGFSANNGGIVSDWQSGLTTISNLVAGAQTFDSDAGMLSWIDMPVTSASSLGTVESYSAQLAGNPLLTIYGQATGSGGIQQQSVGVGTTSPWAAFAVNPVAGDLNQFVVGSSTATNFLINNAGVISLGTGTYSNCTSLYTTTAGVLTCTASDERLKQNVATLDDESGLSAIDALNPVSFNWIDPTRGTRVQYGFIAQQVQQVLPDMVATSSPTALTPDGTLTVDYLGLIAPSIKAIQELHLDLEAITTNAASTTPASEAFAGSFWSALQNNIASWLASAANGIQNIFAQKVTTQELCIGTGANQTCVTQSQLQQILEKTNQAVTTSSDDSTDTPPDNSSSTTDSGTSSTTPTDTSGDTGSTSSTTPSTDTTSSDTSGGASDTSDTSSNTSVDTSSNTSDSSNTGSNTSSGGDANTAPPADNGTPTP